MPAFWLTNSKGQALLAKRAAVKDIDPGKYEPTMLRIVGRLEVRANELLFIHTDLAYEKTTEAYNSR